MVDHLVPESVHDVFELNSFCLQESKLIDFRLDSNLDFLELLVASACFCQLCLRLTEYWLPKCLVTRSDYPAWLPGYAAIMPNCLQIQFVSQPTFVNQQHSERNLQWRNRSREIEIP